MKGNASSFADPADVAAFKHCKSHGLSDKVCFGVGDNAIGLWDDSTAEGTGPSCAISPDVIRAKWTNLHAGRLKEVLVKANGKQVVCLVKDVLPPSGQVKHGVVIDLNPDACFHLGLTPPLMTPCEWQWV